jgi:uncharacterized protein (TIGR02001 family)
MCALAASSVATASVAIADEWGDAKFGYSLTVSATSDYIFRGVSFSDSRPAFQPMLELTYGIAYIDFWGSNIHNGCPAPDACYQPWEMDIYAGIRPVTGPINWDIGLLYYTYPAAPGAGQLDYIEGKISATTTPITNLTLGFNAYATPDQGLAVTETETIEGTAAYTLPQFAIFTPTVSGLIGYAHSASNSDFQNGYFLSGHDYTYWNAGVKLTVEKFFMDFRYWDTNIDRSEDPNDVASARFVFSAGVNLP